MGMFDYIQWNARLPCTHDARMRQRNPFQSKSVRLWETERWGQEAYDHGCVKITVTPAGCMLGPDGSTLLWTGDMSFYDATAEFDATFDLGQLQTCSAAKLPKGYASRPTTYGGR